jgi:hypothetical protein
MDAKELAAFLAAFDQAQASADAALRLWHPRLPIRARENVANTVRSELARLRAMMDGVREDDEMRRREFLSLPLAALAVSPASLERISVAHSVDSALLDAYEDVLVSAVRAYASADMSSFWSTLHPYVVQMGGRLSAPMTQDLRARLAKLVGHTTALAARSAQVVGNMGAANSMALLLDETARNVQDSELLALSYAIRGRQHSSFYAGRWTYSPVTVTNLDAATQTLGPGGPVPLRRELLAMYAEEVAMMGGRAALPVIEQLRALPKEDTGPGLWEPGYFVPATVDGAHTEAVARAVMGETATAERLLHADIAATAPIRIRAHARVRADLAQTYIRAREPEQAARTASEALDLALGVGDRLGVQRVRRAAEGMRQWDIGSVRTLRERLATAA